LNRVATNSFLPGDDPMSMRGNMDSIHVCCVCALPFHHISSARMICLHVPIAAYMHITHFTAGVPDASWHDVPDACERVFARTLHAADAPPAADGLPSCTSTITRCSVAAGKDPSAPNRPHPAREGVTLISSTLRCSLLQQTPFHLLSPCPSLL
jgi:hypothetical protein